MAEYLIEDTTLTNLGDSIRGLNDTTATLTPAQMKNAVDNAVSEINEQTDLIAQCLSALENKTVGSGSIELQEKTITPTTSSQIVEPDDGYDGLSKVTVNGISTATQATPIISVSSAGKITASATQNAGYVAAGTKTATKSLSTQAAKTITPTKSSQTAVTSGKYTTGTVTVAAIPSSYIQPAGTLNITSNGIYDCFNYSSINVEISSTIPGDYIDGSEVEF